MLAARADADLADLARRQSGVAVAEDRDLDQRLLRAAGRRRLGDIAAPEIGAAGGVGLGQAIAERRIGVRELLLSRSTWLIGRGAPPAVMSRQR